jgi:hypothetical protein
VTQAIYTLHSSSRKITFTLSRGWGLAGIETAAKADLFAFSYGMPEGMPGYGQKQKPNLGRHSKPRSQVEFFRSL